MIIAANFKSYHTRKGTLRYLDALEHFMMDEGITQEVMVFPPATALEHHDGHVTVGAQNAYPVQNGAYTGEIAMDQLEEFDIDTIMIGHSERRGILGETQEQIAAKFRFFKERHFTIVYCIGEPLEIREAGNDELMRYLDAQFDGIDLSYDRLIVAYEPVWAIGTGMVPTERDIELILSALKQQFAAPLLYGGSVKTDNAEAILALDNVDGILVGSGALEVEDFCRMITIAQQLHNKENE